MFRIRDLSGCNSIRISTRTVFIIAICLLMTSLINTASAQPFINLSTDDVYFEPRDSTFEVPIYLQTLSDEIAAFQIWISFDNPEAAVFDMSNVISDSAEAVWNWGFIVNDMGTDGRVLQIISAAMFDGEPISPSATVHKILTLNALAGDSSNENHCDSMGAIYFENVQIQFSDPVGGLLEFTSENGSYTIICPGCGDVNYDKDVNVSDGVYIINYVFTGGFVPVTMAAGDVNCDGECNVSDAVAIINYVFAGGNAPCDTDGDGEPDC
jgi:hypothetical protein